MGAREPRAQDSEPLPQRPAEAPVISTFHIEAPERFGASGVPHESTARQAAQAVQVVHSTGRVSGPSHGLPRGPLQKRPAWVQLAGGEEGGQPLRPLKRRRASWDWTSACAARTTSTAQQPLLPVQAQQPRGTQWRAEYRARLEADSWRRAAAAAGCCWSLEPGSPGGYGEAFGGKRIFSALISAVKAPRENSLPEVSTDDASVEGGDDATMAAEEAVSISAEKCNTPTIVPNAPKTTEDTDFDNEGVNLTPSPQMGDSQPQRFAWRGRRRRHLTHDAGDEDASTQLFLGQDASLLSSQCLQNKHMWLMNRNVHHMQQTLRWTGVVSPLAV
ncbi:hypothetical protein NDU88_005591 [Pleurodeles waltl]|uniref:Uncharacterized protein n=1 Tax=Pleurodeles waltl TaxID=8319 RepID=A0AAV7SM43_PLEWA|nr:hypothetical protein NDU88_005591 [Pleurodeles waltl]